MKAVLVIETPRYCYECPCLNKENDYCQVNGKNVNTGIPSWCPLRPLPEKKTTKYPIWADRSYDDFDKGYNACLKEITGEEK